MYNAFAIGNLMSHVHVQCVGPLARSSLLGAHCPGFLVLLCMPITSHTAAGLRFDPPWSIPEACSHDWMRCAHHRAPICYKGVRSKCQWNNKKSRNQQKNNSKSPLSLSLPWVALGRVGRSARPAARRRRRSVGYTDGCQRYLEGGRRVWWCTKDATHVLVGVWSRPAPPATTRRQPPKRVPPRNMSATSRDTDPTPSPQTARASLAASPMYDPGVSSSKRVLASSGISRVCTKARMPAASTRRPRVSSLSFS